MGAENFCTYSQVLRTIFKIVGLAIFFSACKPAQPVLNNPPAPTATDDGGSASGASTIRGSGPVVANGVAFSTITITLIDDLGRGLEGITPRFTATNTGSTNTYGPCSVSNAKGISTCRLYSRRAEAKNLNVTFPLNFSGGSVNFVHGPPTHLAFTRQPSLGGIAGEAIPIQPQVQLRDQFNNIALTALNSVTVNAYTNSTCTNLGGGVFNAAVNPIIGDGFSGTYSFAGVSYTTAETIYLGFTTPGLPRICSNPLTIVNNYDYSLVITTQPSANGVAGNDLAVSPRVEIQDQFGNRAYVGGYDDAAVTFAAFTDASCTTPAPGTLRATNGNPLSAVNAVVPPFVFDYTAAGTVYIGTSSPGMTGSCTNAINLVPNSASSLTSTIAGTGPIAANNYHTSTVTITIYDEFLNPRAGDLPTFSATNSGANNTYGACSVTNASGVSTCTMRSGFPEVKTLSIQTPTVAAGGTINFIIPPDPANTTAVGSTTVANDVDLSTITITLLDSVSNPVIGLTPEFSATNTNTTNTATACSVTNGSGVSTCTLRSRYAESKTISLSQPLIMVGGIANFIAGPPVALNSQFSSTTNTIADGVDTSDLTVFFRDQFLNPVPNITPTFSATDTGGTNAYQACSASDGTGNSYCTMTSTFAETKALNLITPFALAGGNTDFIPGPPSYLVFQTQPSASSTAGVVFAQQPVVELYDSFNNIVHSATDAVTLEPHTNITCTNLGGGILGATQNPVSANGTNGRANFAGLNYTASGPLYLRASLLNGAEGCSNLVTINAAAPTPGNSEISLSSPVIADGVDEGTISIILRDQFNNPTPGYTPSFSATDTNGTNLYDPCSVTDISGTALCTMTSTYAELKTVELLTPVNITGNAGLFTAGTPAQLVFTTQPNANINAGSVFTQMPVVQIQDAFNNPVLDATLPISLSDYTDATCTTPGSGSFVIDSNPVNANGTSGESGFTGISETTAGPLYFRASSGGLTTACSTLITVTPLAPEPSQSTIIGSGPVTADNISASTVTITLLDIYNNPLSGITPTFSATNTNNGNNYGACSATNALGVSTCNLLSTFAENKTLSLTSPIAKIGGDVLFNPGAASKLVFTQQPSATGTVDAALVIQPIIQVQDAFNNPLNDSTLSITLSDFTNAGCTIAGPGTMTIDSNPAIANGTSGEASFTGLKDTTAQTLHLRASSGALATACSTAIVLAPGAPTIANSSITGTTPVTADGVDTSIVTINLSDSFNNPVPGVTPNFVATNTNATNSYGACSATNSIGEATCSLSSLYAETKLLEISAPIAKTGTSVVFEAGAPAAIHSTITGTSSITSDGVATSTITIVLKDAQDNPVAGQTPTFVATDTGATNAYGACSVTNTSGLSTCTMTSTRAESKILSIATPVIKSGDTIVFVPGGADPLYSYISGTGPLTANGTATSTITIVIKDINNNNISGVTPTFNATDTNATNIQTACSSTNSSGISTCTLASLTAETKTLTILTPVNKAGGNVIFNPDVPSTATSTIIGSGPVTADGVASSTITITILDSNSNPISGTTPTFDATDTNGTNVYGACSATNASGVSSCTLTSTRAETKTLSLTSPISKADGTVVFNPGAAAVATSTIIGTGPNIADGVATSAITITLLDAQSNPISGTTPTFTATDTGSTNTYNPCSATDTNGVSTCTFTSTRAETKTLSIASPIVKADGTVVFNAGPVSMANSTITGTGPVIADGVTNSTITITLLDASSNPVAGTVPTFSATDSGTTNNYGACSTTNGSGVSTCTLSSIRAETKTLSIATPIVKADGTVVFNPGAASIANSTITGTGSVTADGVATSTITITLLDANSNPLVGTTPTFSATDSGTTNHYGACSATDASGVSSCTLASTRAETKTLSIATPIIKADGTVVFDAGAASTVTSTIIGSGPVLADGIAASTITITLLDVSNNPISGVTPTFSATDSGGTNDYSVCSATDGSGISTCTLSSNRSEVKTLSLTSPINMAGGTVVFSAHYLLELDSSSDPVNFGSLNAGETHTFVVVNNSSEATGLITVNFNADVPAQWEITPADTCSGVSLAPTQTCSVDINFLMDTPGTYSAVLEFLGAAGGELELNLTATQAL